LRPLWKFELTKQHDQLYYSKLSPTRTLILFILDLKQHLPCLCIQKSSFLEQIFGNSSEIIHFEA